MRAFASQSTTAEAVFAEFDWAISDRWTLTVGGRYTREEKEAERSQEIDVLGDGLIIIPDFSTFGDPTEDDWNEFTPKVSLSWYATDDVMLYATYSEGFRSGGMNGRAGTEFTARLTYDPEFVDMFEIGMKSSWLDNRIQFNAAIFDQSFLSTAS